MSSSPVSILSFLHKLNTDFVPHLHSKPHLQNQSSEILLPPPPHHLLSSSSQKSRNGTNSNSVSQIISSNEFISRVESSVNLFSPLAPASPSNLVTTRSRPPPSYVYLSPNCSPQSPRERQEKSQVRLELQLNGITINTGMVDQEEEEDEDSPVLSENDNFSLSPELDAASPSHNQCPDSFRVLVASISPHPVLTSPSSSTLPLSTSDSSSANFEYVVSINSSSSDPPTISSSLSSCSPASCSPESFSSPSACPSSSLFLRAVHFVVLLLLSASLLALVVYTFTLRSITFALVPATLFSATSVIKSSFISFILLVVFVFVYSFVWKRLASWNVGEKEDESEISIENHDMDWFKGTDDVSFHVQMTQRSFNRRRMLATIPEEDDRAVLV